MDLHYHNLAQLELFQTLSPDTIRAVGTVARVYTLERNEVLFHRGDEAVAFYVVLEGGVQIVEDSPAGRRISLELNGRGDVFGLLALTGPKHYPHTASAIDTSKVMAIHGTDARQLIQTQPDFALTIIDLLISRVHRANARVRQMATEPADRRLARTLLSYANKFGQENNGGIVIGVALPQQDLADFTGTALETINRTLRQWEKQGWVCCSRQRVEIVDMAALNALVAHGD